MLREDLRHKQSHAFAPSDNSPTSEPYGKAVLNEKKNTEKNIKNPLENIKKIRANTGDKNALKNRK